ncbi:MAG: phytanoyl-CoA dioxygenase family protein [Rhizomicrobium sp.]
MLQRIGGNLRVRKQPAPAASEHLEREGYAHIGGVLTADEVAALGAEIAAVFDASGTDRERDLHNEFRYGMLNRSALTQGAIASRALLDVIEPLLGEDCHVIANTAWRNAPGHEGGRWHCDAGPHVPRPENVSWPDAIPYPVFAIGVHLFLVDCPMEAGPTAVLPGSHRSGRLPPKERLFDLDLTFENKTPVYLPAKAGDAILFVSDLWHRGTPAQARHGRFFLQCHYGRRDLAQRIDTTANANHLTPDAIARARTDRERTLIGLHPPHFYDG